MRLARPADIMLAAASIQDSKARGQDAPTVSASVKGYQMPAAESRRSTKTPNWIIAVEPGGYSGRR